MEVGNLSNRNPSKGVLGKTFSLPAGKFHPGFRKKKELEGFPKIKEKLRRTLRERIENKLGLDALTHKG